MPHNRPGPSVACALALALAVAAAAMVLPARAAAMCTLTPACLEANFPPDLAWAQLHPGPAGNDSPEQMTAVTSNQPWGLRVASDLADGRMREWTGSAYIATAPKILTNPLEWTLSSIDAIAQPPSHQALSSTAATVVSGRPSTCISVCSSAQIGVRYRQLVSFADVPAGANDYRLRVTYEAAQGF